MHLRLNGRPIQHAPYALTAVRPAWGPALRSVRAGVASSLFVRLQSHARAYFANGMRSARTETEAAAVLCVRS